MADTWDVQEDETFPAPGSRLALQQERLDAQQSGWADFADGFRSTALAAGWRKVRDEAPVIVGDAAGGKNPITWAASGLVALSGLRKEELDYDKQERFEELTKGIPYEYHDDILDHDNYAAATRARQRVLADLERYRRMGLQDSGTLSMLAGSLFDIDMPLAFFSGGAYGAAKVSRAALKASQLAGLSPKAALRLSGSAQGANAGLQAGVLVGAGDAAWSETTDWQDIANIALMSMALGTGIGTATRGDIRTSVRAAQAEYYERIARGDADLDTPLDVNAMPVPSLAERLAEAGPVEPSIRIEDPDAPVNDKSIGAAQAAPLNTFTSTATPGATPTNQAWIDAAENWRHDSGWQDTKDAVADEWWAKAATSGAGSFTTNDFVRLYQSKSAVANYLAGTVFESASGLGRGNATAATRMENYHRRIQSVIASDVLSAAQEWAKTNGKTWQNSGYHISTDGMRVFNREVMLELNDRAMGRSSTRNPEIKRAADHYEMAGAEALGIARGRDGETPIDGFQNVPDRRGYTPYRWSGSKITELEKSGEVTRDEIVTALADAYQMAGLGVGKDAKAVAKAVVHRAITKDQGIDTSVLSLLSGDGKDFIRESLILGGMKEADADTVIARLVGKQHNASKDSYAKTRNEVDMSTSIPTKSGKDLRIVDLMDNDMHGIWQQYSRQVSGSAALARQGITNRAQRRELIDAMRAEQRALGEEPMEAEMIEAMLSHFNGGPVHGYAFGKTNEGIGVLATAKRITNLALLEKLGVTQLAETGVIMAQNGLSNWLQRGPMAVFDKQLRDANQELLDDMAFFTGEIGRDHVHFAPWMDLDDTLRSDRAEWLRTVNKWTQKGSQIQGYTSVFNHVRSFQQKTAALGVADKVMRELKKVVDTGTPLDERTALRFMGDLGLDATHVNRLEQLIANGTIEFSTTGRGTFVNRLNMDQWDSDLGEVFASSIVRNLNQLVQKSMSGEQDAWMHTGWGSILTHLKTFPLQAIQKQVIRNARYLDKQALGTVLMGMSTAAVAVMVRDAIDGRERSVEEVAKAAFSYSNMTGFIPMVMDPMMTFAGLDEHRFNPYGPTFDWTPPTVKIANDLLRVPGALANTVTGNDDWHDRQAIKAIPFMGTYGLSRAFD